VTFFSVGHSSKPHRLPNPLLTVPGRQMHFRAVQVEDRDIFDQPGAGLNALLWIGARSPHSWWWRPRKRPTYALSTPA
jgi:hypothetical protein